MNINPISFSIVSFKPIGSLFKHCSFNVSYNTNKLHSSWSFSNIAEPVGTLKLDTTINMCIRYKPTVTKVQ